MNNAERLQARISGFCGIVVCDRGFSSLYARCKSSRFSLAYLRATSSAQVTGYRRRFLVRVLFVTRHRVPRYRMLPLLSRCDKRWHLIKRNKKLPQFTTTTIGNLTTLSIALAIFSLLLLFSGQSWLQRLSKRKPGSVVFLFLQWASLVPITTYYCRLPPV